MHFYSRTGRPSAQGSQAQFPGGIIGPDGQLHLGIPIITAANPATQGPDPYTRDTSSRGVTVLMQPGPPDEENAPRAPLFLTLVADVVLLAIMLSELSWRKVHVHYMLTLGLTGLAVDMLGLVSCCYRLPSMLGLFAVTALLHFFVSAMPTQSLTQLTHCTLQPLLVSFALTLRRSRIPLWFSTGRPRG